MRPARRKNKTGMYLLLALAFVMMQLGWWSSRLLIMAPGKPIRLDETVIVEKGKPPGSGAFLATTVYAEPAGPLTGLYAVFNRDTDLYVNARDMDLWNDGYRLTMALDFHDSLRVAAAVALRELGYVVGERKGLQVRGVAVNGPCDGKARIGDILLWADGKRVESSLDLLGILQDKGTGDLLTMGLDRNGRIVEYTCRISDPDAAGYEGLGLSMLDHTDYRFPLRLDYSEMDISGNSAGLMFALEIHSRLAESDVRRGRVIAGTGALTDSGLVTAVSGIKQKVVSARQWGADVFLVPYANEEEAKRYAGDMRVIPVEDFGDCIEKLSKKGHWGWKVR